MSVKYTSVPPKRLSSNVTASATSFQINNIKGWDGSDLTASDFGSVAYGVFRDDANTIIEFFEWDPSTVASSSITINKRGLQFDGNLTTEVSANKLLWQKDVTVVELGSNPSQIYQYLQEYADAVASSGAADASTTVKGIVEEATQAEIDAGTAAGSTSARLFVNPSTLSSSLYATRLPSADQKNALSGTRGVPSSTNKYGTYDHIYSDNVDQSQTTQDSLVQVGEADTSGQNNKLAQSFVPVRTKIRGVILDKQADTGSFTGTVTVALQADSSGDPSGSNLASVTITNADWLALSTGEFTATFSSEYQSMVAGDTYHIVVTTSTSDNTNHPNLGINSAGGYASGSLKAFNTTDSWFAETGDLYFKTLNGHEDQIITSDSSGKIPVTFIPPLAYAAGTVSKDISSTTSTTIAHGLSVIPSIVRLNAFIIAGGSATTPDIYQSFGTFDGTNQVCVYATLDWGNGIDNTSTTTSYSIVIQTSNGGDSLSGSVSVDDTNITIAWTKAGTPTGTYDFLWEAHE